jgi:hypothetical protein
LEIPRGRGLGAIAKLKPGIGLDRFQSELAVRTATLASQFPSTNRDLRFAVTRVSSFLLGDRLLLLRWLMIAVLLLLRVAAANASGIWLAQWLRQQHRVVIQLCLGASKRRFRSTWVQLGGGKESQSTRCASRLISRSWDTGLALRCRLVVEAQR